MATIILVISLVITIITPSLLYFGFKMSGTKMKYALVIDVLSFLFICVAATIVMANGGTVLAEGAAPVVNNTASFAFVSAALATGLASIGAGIAVAASASAAIGAISENPTVMGKALIFVALAEGIALYGLLISFTIIGKI